MEPRHERDSNPRPTVPLLLASQRLKPLGHTTPLASPRTFREKKMKKKKKKSINNISTEVVQRKIKIQFCQKMLEVLSKKTLFVFVFSPGQISVTIKDRDTGIFCRVSKTIPIVQR